MTEEPWQFVFSTAAWRRTKAEVLKRSGGACEYSTLRGPCGRPAADVLNTYKPSHLWRMYPDPEIYVRHALQPTWLKALCREHYDMQSNLNRRSLGP